MRVLRGFAAACALLQAASAQNAPDFTVPLKFVAGDLLGPGDQTLQALAFSFHRGAIYRFDVSDPSMAPFEIGFARSANDIKIPRTYSVGYHVSSETQGTSGAFVQVEIKSDYERASLTVWNKLSCVYCDGVRDTAASFDVPVIHEPVAAVQQGNHTGPCENAREFVWLTDFSGELRMVKALHPDHEWHNVGTSLTVQGRQLEVFHLPPKLILLCDFGTNPVPFANDQGQWKKEYDCDDGEWSKDGYCSAYVPDVEQTVGITQFIRLDDSSFTAAEVEFAFS